MLRAWLAERARYDIRKFMVEKTYVGETIFGHKFENLVKVFPAVVDPVEFKRNRMLDRDKQEELIDYIYHQHLEPALQEAGVVYWFPLKFNPHGFDFYDPSVRMYQLTQDSAGAYFLEHNPVADLDVCKLIEKKQIRYKGCGFDMVSMKPIYEQSESMLRENLAMLPEDVLATFKHDPDVMKATEQHAVYLAGKFTKMKEALGQLFMERTETIDGLEVTYRRFTQEERFHFKWRRLDYPGWRVFGFRYQTGVPADPYEHNKAENDRKGILRSKAESGEFEVRAEAGKHHYFSFFIEGEQATQDTSFMGGLMGKAGEPETHYTGFITLNLFMPGESEQALSRQLSKSLTRKQLRAMEIAVSTPERKCIGAPE